MNKHILVAAAALVLSGAASAQGYLAASVGSSRLTADCTGTSSCDNTDVGFKLLGGYKFMPNLAAELAYFNFGKATASAGNVNAEVKNTAVGVGIALHGDLAPNWPAVARLGAAQVKTKLSGSVAGLGSASVSDNNISLYGGLGIGYKLAKDISLDGAWDFSRSKYDVNGVRDSGSLNMISIGMTFWF